MLTKALHGTAFLLAASLLQMDTGSPGAAQSQLAKLQPLVGEWRGVGQPQRGSSKDSWTESASWAWNFAAEGPALVAESPQGRYFRRLRLTAGPGDEFTLLLTPSAAGASPVRYTGKQSAEGQLVLTAAAAEPGLPQRITFSFAAQGDRLLLLLERPAPTAATFTRLAEIGYTRQGSQFGQGTAQRECIVTGGLGTIPVTYEGQTYYVCCTGCRDYFQADPKKALADYAAKKKK